MILIATCSSSSLLGSSYCPPPTAYSGYCPLPQLGGGAGRGAVPNVSGELVVVHVTAGPLIENDTDV